MAHAATKSSCGVNGAIIAAASLEMAELISRTISAIFQVKVVSVTGNFIAELSKSKTKGDSTCWIFYVTFLSVTRSLKRLLDKWSAITTRCKERARKALRANHPPPEFPLANHYDDLIHVLPVLSQFGEIKLTCQAERSV
ncbi:unnamed protein product [Peronospora belbahrii]|uniref:Uncharacterized protein n=1 Tax=Peronospora belbahrii TaxID=622444 RepID=A0AAU9LAS0_9STRA|nr:unnamed protein product [Peronospora belbahrii]